MNVSYSIFLDEKQHVFFGDFSLLPINASVDIDYLKKVCLLDDEEVAELNEINKKLEGKNLKIIDIVYTVINDNTHCMYMLK